MHKKDYVLLANVLVQFRAKAQQETDGSMEFLDHRIDDLLDRELIIPLAKALKAENPHFDYARFLRACGVEVA